MERRNAALKELADLLREEAYTARGIVDALAERGMKVSKPTAYARVSALILSGHRVVTARVREGVHGPLATAYHLLAT